VITLSFAGDVALALALAKHSADDETARRQFELTSAGAVSFTKWVDAPLIAYLDATGGYFGKPELIGDGDGRRPRVAFKRLRFGETIGKIRMESGSPLGYARSCFRVEESALGSVSLASSALGSHALVPWSTLQTPLGRADATPCGRVLRTTGTATGLPSPPVSSPAGRSLPEP
jgi:hypothetical protein